MEKVIATIQLVQLYALVLLLSEEWKLPYNWRIWVNWTMVFIAFPPIDKLDFALRGQALVAISVVLAGLSLLVAYGLYHWHLRGK